MGRGRHLVTKACLADLDRERWFAVLFVARVGDRAMGMVAYEACLRRPNGGRVLYRTTFKRRVGTSRFALLLEAMTRCRRYVPAVFGGTIVSRSRNIVSAADSR